MALNYVDLSHTLNLYTQVYPGDPSFSCCPLLTIERDGNNVASISMGSHTGTHVDAPYHFIEDGRRIDDIPISRFVGPALVVDLSSKGSGECIVWSDLAPYEETLKRRVSENPDVILLIRTDW
ncbi:putative cyclase [Daedalea quercina L-15889]|uniref:Putative cyclase n=1 Tax=Daedalea quercina L-15889 TaxID=1314783 RepID=A0A165SSU5_9APHY|nr:putative cyclase [Daedalea quercina L-15889]